MSTVPRIDELRKKFEENPRRYFAPLANELRKARELAQAIALCREHLPKQPGHMSGHIVFGQALYENGDLEEARIVFEQALALDPENLIALRHLGDIARQQGHASAARRWYERVLEADPRNDDIAAQLATLAMLAATPPRGSVTVPAPNPEPEANPLFDAEPTPAVAAQEPAAAADPFFGVVPVESEAGVLLENLDVSFEEGFIATAWPDTSDLAERATRPVTPRSITPPYVELPPAAAQAFGHEPGDPIEPIMAAIEPEVAPEFEGMTSPLGALTDVHVTGTGDHELLAEPNEPFTVAGLVGEETATIADSVEGGAAAADHHVDEVADIDAPTAAVWAAPVVELPVAEAPVVEAPVVEAPVVEAPVAEAPVAEAPVGEAPVAEAPVAEAPIAETPAEHEAIAEAPAEDHLVVAAEPVASAPIATEPMPHASTADVATEASPAEASPAERSAPESSSAELPAAELSGAPAALADTASTAAVVDTAAEQVVTIPVVTFEPHVGTMSDEPATAPSAGASATVPGAEPTAAASVTDSTSPPNAFLTETMGELLASQGYLDGAIDVYAELVRRRPMEPALAARLAALQHQRDAHPLALAAAVAAPAPHSAEAPAPAPGHGGWRTARARFAALAARRVQRPSPGVAAPVSQATTESSDRAVAHSADSESRAAAELTADAMSFAKESVADAAPPAPEPAAAASPVHAESSPAEIDSLAGLFGSVTSPQDDAAARALSVAFGAAAIGGTGATPSLFATESVSTASVAVTPSSGAPLHAQPVMAGGTASSATVPNPNESYSFDRFFPDPATPGSSGASPANSATPSAISPPPVPNPNGADVKVADDLAQFSAWLKGLGSP